MQKNATGRLVTLLGIFLFATPCAGQVSSSIELSRDSLYRHISREHSADATFHFSYPQGSGKIHSDLGGNAAELDRLGTFICQALEHPELTIGRIYLTGYSSIEGSYARNEALSRERVEQLYHYLRTYYPDLHRYPHNLAWVAEDWDGLARMVRRSNLNEREEIIEIIRKVRIYDDREALLIRLNGGRAYQEMERTMFAKLRKVELRVEYTEQKASSQEGVETAGAVDSTPEEPVVNKLDNPSPDAPQDRESNLWRQERFILKTNLLQWAGIAADAKYTTVQPNIALEYLLTSKWSIELGAMYACWRNKSNSKFQGISGYRIESRYRFPVVSERLWTYLGTYFRIGDYDLSTSRPADSLSFGEGWGEASTGDYWDAGLSAGVAVKIVGGLGLEIGARAGYVKSDIIYYTKDGEYNWYESTEPYSKVRITDWNVSLIYRFR